eukprot:351518-Chlamydomonas_euryale.AAC.1
MSLQPTDSAITKSVWLHGPGRTPERARSCAQPHCRPGSRPSERPHGGFPPSHAPLPLAPGAAATAPNAPSPDITLASHSTAPLQVRLDPVPALVHGASCMHRAGVHGPGSWSVGCLVA